MVWWWQKARWKVAFRSGSVLWLLSVPLRIVTFESRNLVAGSVQCADAQRPFRNTCCPSLKPFEGIYSRQLPPETQV
ncbi:hypothetical protein EV421DRAFT_1749804 [Armillaria borealis]|uniref:Uncharacterized protein n=1 Tax=Armillaria borealis TaxID=47425 RepID=A0AA39N3G0_9AGAR|nr:hypothetical protein EV421DRAFT_1749804 [Armillaria borealis]